MRRGMTLIARMVFFLAAAALPVALNAAPISAAGRARLAAGKDLYVVVEFDGASADTAANAERSRRRLPFDDQSTLALRSSGYAAIKARVELQARGSDAARVLDYSHFPLAVWRLSSAAALTRLESNLGVRMVHENLLLHPVSVSDLGFIHQPQAAAQGATGSGTTIAVIDGGLGNNYALYSDFTTPRLDLLAAVDQGTAIALSGSGPTQAVSGNSATYIITVTDTGPLAATNVVMTDTLPAGATLVSSSSGCTLVGSALSCKLGTLLAGGNATARINVKWTSSGTVYDSASVSSDQVNTAAAAQQTLAFGTPPENSSDGPLPMWAYALLAIWMGFIGRQRLVRAQTRLRQ
jgi:uncharacterized repeat protein (TIGR01451 family)